MENNDILNILGGINQNPVGDIKIDFSSILKLPLVILLFGNVLFAALAFLRTRILADTFQSSQSGLVKTIVSIYLILTIIGSILAVLFLLLA